MRNGCDIEMTKVEGANYEVSTKGMLGNLLSHYAMSDDHRAWCWLEKNVRGRMQGREVSERKTSIRLKWYLVMSQGQNMNLVKPTLYDDRSHIKSGWHFRLSKMSTYFTY